MISRQLNAYNRSRSENTRRCIFLCLTVELAGKCVLIGFTFLIRECSLVYRRRWCQKYIQVSIVKGLSSWSRISSARRVSHWLFFVLPRSIYYLVCASFFYIFQTFSTRRLGMDFKIPYLGQSNQALSYPAESLPDVVLADRAAMYVNKILFHLQQIDGVPLPQTSSSLSRLLLSMCFCTYSLGVPSQHSFPAQSAVDSRRSTTLKANSRPQIIPQ